MERNMNKEELIKKLDFSARKYKIPLKKRLLKYPFISIRDAFITILFNKILGQKFYFLVKAKTFFNEDFYCIFPESKDIYFYGAYVYSDAEFRLTKFIIKHSFKEDLIFLRKDIEVPKFWSVLKNRYRINEIIFDKFNYGRGLLFL